MIDKIVPLFKEKYYRKEKTYKVTIDTMLRLADLRKSARELLMILLERTGSGYQMSDMVVTGTYQDFGYKHRQHFSSDRKLLVEQGFIVYDGRDHFVNPVFLDHLSRRQKEYFYRKLKLKKEAPVNIGGSIAPPPPPNSK